MWAWKLILIPLCTNILQNLLVHFNVYMCAFWYALICREKFHMFEIKFYEV